MSRGIELIVMGLGGLSLFLVAFLGFAAMSGTPLSEVAVIGPMFAPEEQEPPEEPGKEFATPGTALATEKQIVEANMGILGAFPLESPFTAAELQSLALELKSAKVAYDERKWKLDEREKSISEREEVLAHQFETLEELREKLERYEAELNLRSAEVNADEKATDAQAEAQWSEVAKLFAAGDPDELTTRLLQYDEEEAAKVLVNLSDERAALLLNALPADKWKAYVDAYSAIGEE